MEKKLTIFSLEQALALPFATQRMVHLGWRVIRIESPPDKVGGNPGDPNRYIGADLGYNDLHSYYIAPNLGKEAITINLKTLEGQNLLLDLIKELKVDVFLCNTMPKRYKQLGIDYETLKKANPEIIWCSISAMGPEYPEAAGYDPALQALMGFTYLTGETNGNPVPCGIPIIDLKSGDEAFTQVLLALYEKQKTGKGKEIFISMAQCAASWLITALPQLSFVKSDSELFKRSGNEHRSFIPCNVYPTIDSMVYLAIGNDSQWAKFCKLNGFESLYKKSRITNEGRMNEKDIIYIEIGEISKKYSTEEFVALCKSINLSVAPVNSIKDVSSLSFISNEMLKSTMPGGAEVKLFPPAVETEFLKNNENRLKCAPRLGEHNNKILSEANFKTNEIEQMKANFII
ncbi:MAG: CoA transferase [Bacteroidetes bacterium]|nr:CoA transferase [Bacteroidota bacterium]